MNKAIPLLLDMKDDLKCLVKGQSEMAGDIKTLVKGQNEMAGDKNLVRTE